MVLISDYQLWGAVPAAYFQNLKKLIMNKNGAFYLPFALYFAARRKHQLQKAVTANSHSCVSISRFLVVDSPLSSAPDPHHFPLLWFLLYYLFTR